MTTVPPEGSAPVGSDAPAEASPGPIWVVNSVPVFACPAESMAAAMKLFEQGTGVIVRTAKDLDQISTGGLTKIYNACPGVKPVAKFQDRETANRRVFAILPTHPGGFAQTSSSKEVNVMAPKNRRAAKAPKAPKAPKTPKAKMPKGERPGRAYKTGDAKLIKLSSVNPRRPGTLGYKTWEKFRSGMTMAQAVEAGCRSKDLLWDLELYPDRIKLEKAPAKK